MNTKKQEIYATSRYLRISPLRVNLILKKIRGKSYREALGILKVLPQKAGALVWQTLYSAVSNASNNFQCDKEKLIISVAYANQGPSLKRARARAKGRSFSIKKHMTHLTVIVSEQ
jgi:large subunit ribosomal protein L22